ncbi:hypothetical protein GE061_005894 [Apolygus lucorum]|uniref:Fas-associated factor 1/2-like UAS domain-containing protein n=1 Tax=Apolygus lucorum TaxID=248454 RepID=A0A6A4IYK3_APOLU|nr:hypothetical protein GE061_005894 [Apolygus lucorum]
MSKEDAEQLKVVHEFVSNFNRAAPDFPLMFKGTLDKAISACWPKHSKIDDRRKMLAVYVQKGFDDAFREFIKCLSSQRIKMILMESYIIWGCDVEEPDRFNHLVAMVVEKLDDAGKMIVPELKNNPFPKLYLLEKPHDVITLAHKITKLISEDEMFLELEATVRPILQGVGSLQPMDFKEKRKSSSSTKESLGDRIERRASIIAEHQRERRLLSARMSVQGVPPEPPPSEHGVIVVKFTDRVSTHERRFSEEDTVDGVVNYLISIGYSPDAYRFMGRKSRTDIGKVNRGLRLKALQVGRNEVIVIESVKRNRSQDR